MKDRDAEKRLTHYLEASGKANIQKCKKFRNEVNKYLVSIDCKEKQSAADSRLSTRSLKNEKNEKISNAKILRERKML